MACVCLRTAKPVFCAFSRLQACSDLEMISTGTCSAVRILRIAPCTVRCECMNPHLQKREAAELCIRSKWGRWTFKSYVSEWDASARPKTHNTSVNFCGPCRCRKYPKQDRSRCQGFRKRWDVTAQAAFQSAVEGKETREYFCDWIHSQPGNAPGLVLLGQRPQWVPHSASSTAPNESRFSSCVIEARL